MKIRITGCVEYQREQMQSLIHQSIQTVRWMISTVEVAMQYTTGYHEMSWVSPRTFLHMKVERMKQSFRTAMTRVINDYARKNKLLKDNQDNSNRGRCSIRLTAVISVKHPNPQFEGQTKTKLGNSKVVKITNRLFSQTFYDFLMENPLIAKRIVE